MISEQVIWLKKEDGYKMSIIYNSSSPYFNTQQKNDLVRYLDFMEYRDITADDSDTVLVVGSKFHQRPDLLSDDLYGTPELWWVFIVRNPDQLTDPIYDLVSGLELFVPTKQRLLGLLGL